MATPLAELIVSESDELLPQTAIHSNDAIVEKLGHEASEAFTRSNAIRLESRGPLF